jgi:hypothetical protein
MKTSHGARAPASAAARTWRSRIPLQLQTYMRTLIKCFC